MFLLLFYLFQNNEWSRLFIKRKKNDGFIFFSKVNFTLGLVAENYLPYLLLVFEVSRIHLAPERLVILIDAFGEESEFVNFLFVRMRIKPIHSYSRYFWCSQKVCNLDIMRHY